jgi:hypothetical protein
MLWQHCAAIKHVASNQQLQMICWGRTQLEVGEPVHAHLPGEQDRDLDLQHRVSSQDMWQQHGRPDQWQAMAEGS